MTRVFAHRGASGYAPENSMAAFRLAAEQGADGIELDVHRTRDGEVVVIHDETVDRVLDGSGLVKDMTLAELKRLRFRAAEADARYAGEAVPTLAEVLAFVAPTGMHVNVELKTNVFFYDGIETECLRLAEGLGLSERMLYSSFNHFSLLRVKDADETARCGLLYSATLVRPWAYAAALGMEALHPSLTQLLVPNFVRDAHKTNVHVNTWTVNGETELSLVLAEGPDIVITDFPDRAMAVRARVQSPVCGRSDTER